MSDDLVKALSDLQEPESIRIVEERLARGDDPLNIIDDAREALEIVGKRFEDKDYFIPDLVFSGEILKKINAMVLPTISKETGSEYKTKIVFGTVAGDIHDLGKDIVVFMLQNHNFDVYDLGVDVPPDKFVDKLKETNAAVVGLSAFLTTCFESMKITVDAIAAAGLKDKVKVMIGGGQIDDRVRQYTGADAYGLDAMAAVKLAAQWTQG